MVSMRATATFSLQLKKKIDKLGDSQMSYGKFQT